MGGLSAAHWLLVVAAAVLLFGGGRIAATLGDLGRGIRLFRRELGESEPSPRLEAPGER